MKQLTRRQKIKLIKRAYRQKGLPVGCGGKRKNYVLLYIENGQVQITTYQYTFYKSNWALKQLLEWADDGIVTGVIPKEVLERTRMEI